jgi:hypothetical protein
MLLGMTRPSLLVPALTIAAVLMAAPGVTAAVPPEEQPASIELDLAASNGLDAHLETFDDEITFEISNNRSAVIYEIEGESTEAGLKAQFGKLGLIDVTFKPTKTHETNRPPKGCKGEPWTEREGLFLGTIRFTGEREYVRIEATRARGTMSVTPHWQCRDRKGPIRLNDAPPHFALSSREKAKEAALYARDRRCRCFFGAFAYRDRKEPAWTTFYGAKAENREGMKIGRITFTQGGASTFEFDHEAGIAKVDPPHPFTGTATFKRRPGPDLWRSTLRVPLLGADPIGLHGPSFRANLRNRLPGD